MAKNAKEVAVKSRQTKLSKKTNEELINIILRKDATEHKLSAQIVNFKSEINNLTNTVEALNVRIKNFDADMKGTCETYESKIRTITDAKNVIQEQFSNERMKVSELTTRTNNYLKEIISLRIKLKSWKTLTYIMSVVALICLLGWICC